jgi:rhodanese-related sulfurtransferase
MAKLKSIFTQASLAILFASEASAAGQSCLAAKEQEYAAQFSQVDQVLPHELAALQDHPDDLLLFDVREDGEHAVGTIKGAVRVAPGIGLDALMRQIGPSVTGKTIIVFCSVGYRSSKLADRVRTGLINHGAVRVANLRGGIFAWHNYGRLLTDRWGQTEFVHPYSRHWKQYLDFDHLATMTPRQAEQGKP